MEDETEKEEKDDGFKPSVLSFDGEEAAIEEGEREEESVKQEASKQEPSKQGSSKPASVKKSAESVESTDVSFQSFPKRLVAKKVRIADLTKGKYFSSNKEKMEAAYVITLFGENISRANLLGTVTDKFVNDTGSYASITIDDGTDVIRIKAFKDSVWLFDGVRTGDAVVVIGKVKEYQGETYVNAEIVRVIPQEEAGYENLRRLEILEKLNEQNETVESIRRVREHLSEEEVKEYAKRVGLGEEALEVVLKEREIDYKPKILEILSSLDEGNGVDILKLFEISNLSDVIIERAIDELLEDGDLFEPSPGRFKVIKSN